MTSEIVKEVNKIPVISADQYQHLGKYAGALVLACFEQIGGMERFVEWGLSNPTDFYTKLFTKMISRSTQVEVSGSVSIDDAISRLDAMDADYEVVEPLEYDL